MINVCISCDDNYAKYAGIVIASIILNAKEDDEFSFYILDGGISDSAKIRIDRLKQIRDFNLQYVQIDPSWFDVYKNILTHKYISIATYYRLKLSKLLPNVDRVIYLDCDVIVRSSLKELFNTDLEDNYMAGVIDSRVKYKPKWKDTKYVNAGVLLMDLNKIKQDGIEDKFVEFTKENIERIKAGDQDIINFTLDGKIKIVDDKWNVQVSSFLSRSSFTKDPYIIHYIARQKPWLFGSYNHFKNEYFKVLENTPWAISQDEKIKWGIWNNICSFFHFIKDKPLFFVRPKFWEAVFKTIF
jgi:lipopolysaccharide biosynthesis glycosyltransferase